MAVIQRSGRRFVWETMGTVVSLASATDLTDEETALPRAVFERYEERFSLFLDDSEASRVNRDRTPLGETSPEYRAAYDLAWQWSIDTDGAFQPTRPDGNTDLAGVVKALAIKDAADALRAGGVTDFLINAGGDMWAEGSAPGRPWTAGIIDPHNRQELLSEHSFADGTRALATSGSRERGEHIWRLDESLCFVQVSVVAADILTADILATAIMSGGKAFYVEAIKRWNIEVLAASADGQYFATAAFRA